MNWGDLWERNVLTFLSDIRLLQLNSEWALVPERLCVRFMFTCGFSYVPLFLTQCCLRAWRSLLHRDDSRFSESFVDSTYYRWRYVQVLSNFIFRKHNSDFAPCFVNAVLCRLLKSTRPYFRETLPLLGALIPSHVTNLFLFKSHLTLQPFAPVHFL